MIDLIWLSRFVAGEVWSVFPAFVVSIVLATVIRALQLDGLIRRVVGARVGLAVLLRRPSALSVRCAPAPWCPS
jgi:hypothetical protein